jgi:hypothetical protein
VLRERLAQVDGCICRIKLGGNAIGTGFPVGPDLVLTNYHMTEGLIESKASASKVGSRFDCRVLADGSRSEGDRRGPAAL